MLTFGPIQKRMLKERSGLTIVLLIMAGACALMVMVILFINISYLLDQKIYLSSEEIGKIAQSSSKVINIGFDRYTDTQTSFTMTTTTQTEIGLVGSDLASPLGESSTDREYYVILLENADNTVIYCVDINQAVDLSVGFVSARIKYQDASKDVIEMYQDVIASDKPVFVFYSPDNDSSDILIMSALFAVFILMFFLTAFTQFGQKRTRIGRDIASFGVFKTIVGEINSQYHEPLFSNCNCLMLENFLLIFRGNFTDVLSMRNIRSVSYNREGSENLYEMELVHAVKGIEKTYHTYFETEEDAQIVTEYIRDYA